MAESTLSIRLDTDGFSFSVYDPIHNTIFFSRKEIDPVISFTANLKQVFREADFLNHPYKRIRVLFVNRRFTFIPLELFDEEQADTLFYYNQMPKENEVVLYNVLRKNNMVVLWGVDKSVYNFLNERYDSPKYYSQASSMIEYFSVKSRLGNTKKMYAYIRNNALDLYCFERGHLLIANSFQCKNDEDRQYYLLYTWKQLNMDQERDELHLVAEFGGKSKLQSELNRFIKQVFIINPSSEINRATMDGGEKIPFDMQILISNE